MVWVVRRAYAVLKSKRRVPGVWHRRVGLSDDAHDHSAVKGQDKAASSHHVAPPLVGYRQDCAIITFVFSKGYFARATLFLRKSRVLTPQGARIPAVSRKERNRKPSQRPTFSQKKCLVRSTSLKPPKSPVNPRSAPLFRRKSVFLTPIRKEILQNPFAGCGRDAVINLGHMVALGMRKHPRAVRHTARLRV